MVVKVAINGFGRKGRFVSKKPDKLDVEFTYISLTINRKSWTVVALLVFGYIAINLGDELISIVHWLGLQVSGR